MVEGLGGKPDAGTRLTAPLHGAPFPLLADASLTSHTHTYTHSTCSRPRNLQLGKSLQSASCFVQHSAESGQRRMDKTGSRLHTSGLQQRQKTRRRWAEVSLATVTDCTAANETRTFRVPRLPARVRDGRPSRCGGR